MILVVDANIVLAAVIRNSTSRRLLLDLNLSLFAPEVLKTEVLRHIDADEEIQQKVNLPVAELRDIFDLICSRITFIHEEIYSKYEKESMEVAPHKEDAPYIALALHLQCPLWSHDGGIAKQKLVEVVNTKQIIDHLVV